MVMECWITAYTIQVLGWYEEELHIQKKNFVLYQWPLFQLKLFSKKTVFPEISSPG